MRGLDEDQTAQTMMNGMRIYYNFIRPHMALDRKTPAEKAYVGIENQNKWLQLIEKSSKNQIWQI